MTLVLREADVESLVDMADVIAALTAVERAAAAGRAFGHPRDRVRLPTGMLHLLAGAMPEQGVVGFKAYTAFRGVVRFKIFLYDAGTGVLLSIVEGGRLGQLRTGAATAVAAAAMARTDARVLGLVGTGFQAEGQLEAMAACRELSEVRIFGRDPVRREAFAARAAARSGLSVRAVADARSAVEGADLVVAATTSRDPVVQGDWLAPGAFVAGVGANLLIRRELDGSVLRRAARIATDSRAQARLESGALQHAVEVGQLHWEQVVELSDIVSGRVPGRTSPAEITVFVSLGRSLWDLASAHLVYQRALSAGRGETIALE